MRAREHPSIIVCMDAQISELFRLLQNLIRLGTIAEVDCDHVRVKTGNITTGWLRWLTHRAGNTSTWWQPSIGEQVVILSPGGELTAGIVLPSIYSDQHPAPSLLPHVHTTHYHDGAVIGYDHEAHALTATLPGGGTILLDAPASVTVNTQSATVNADTATLNAPESLCTGNLTVQGKIIGQGGMAISGGAPGGPAATITGGIKATGDIAADGDITAGDISLRDHPHGETGNQTTPPLPS